MSKTFYRFTKLETLTLIGVVICVLSFGSARRADASGFGVSLNLGGTSITLGIGDSKPATPAPVVIAQEPAFIPPIAVAPEPKPRPRFTRNVPSKPTPMKKSFVSSPKPGAPVYRSQALERTQKKPGNYPPVDAARARR